MFPKFNFDDSLAAIERLGKKKETNVHMTRYRMGQLTKDDEDRILLEEDENREQETQNPRDDEPMDEFEALIDEQIALSTVQSRTHTTLPSDQSFGNISTISGIANNQNTSVPALSQSYQSALPTQVELSDEIRARIAENKRRALAILEQRKKEAEELRLQELQENEKQKSLGISNVYIDDDDF